MAGNFMAWFVVGGMVGWLASALLRIASREGLLLNIAIGVLGAVLAGSLLAPMVAAAPVSVAALAVVALGAAGLLFIVAAVSACFRRARAR